MYDREDDNLVRKGFGMSITRLSSDYDDDSSRKEIMIQGLIPVSYSNGKGLKLASIGRFGYGDGSYKRYTRQGKYESDLSEWLYGLGNAARYELKIGELSIYPTAEFNVLGYWQGRIREDKDKTNAINVKSENNLSVEGGIGLHVKKEVMLSDNSSIKLRAGGMYYHEFAEPYHSLRARLSGSEGSYKIRDYEHLYDRNRGVLSAGADYEIGSFTLYGNFSQYIEDENPFSLNAGLKYRF